MSVTELRVHGVGGETPEHTLDGAPATRVAGDDQSGFYVVGDAAHQPDPRREAYSWGHLTSGRSTRALWLLLLPFTLINLSFWMGPRKDDRRADVLVRLLALSVTATATLSAVGVGTDLFGWQCASRPECADRHAFLHFLSHGWLATPGRRTTVASVLPLAVLLLLWQLSRSTGKRYEARKHEGAGGDGLATPTFWYGERQLSRLRALHLSVGLAVVGLALIWPAMTRDWHHDHGRAAVDVLVTLLLYGVIVGCAVVLGLPAVVKRDAYPHKGAQWPERVPLVAGAVLVLAILVAAVPDRPGWVATGELPGFGIGVTSVFLLQLAGVLAILRVTKLAFQSMVAGVGLLLAATFSAGVAFRVADWLNGGQAATDTRLLELPVSYGWAALGFAVVLVVGVPAAGIALWRRLRETTKADEPRVRADYDIPATEHDPTQEQRINRVAHARAVASLTDDTFPLVKAFTGVAIGITVVVMALSIVTQDTPVNLVRTGTVYDLLRLGTLWGTWGVGALAIALVALGRKAYDQPALRRTVGILWDVGTFWPRAAHPFAPPCYAERVIPDLSVRVCHLARTTDGVVLSGHSQGSVLTAALLWQLPEDVVRRTRLITHGCPLRRLYAVAFPAWFGDLEALERLIGRGGWTNLWRTTDYIGGSVDLAADVQLVRDPDFLDPPPGDPADPVPGRHSGMNTTPTYFAALGAHTRDLELRRQHVTMVT